MTEVNNIVTLTNGNDFWILETLEYQGKKYVYTERVLEDETETGEFVIFEATVKEGEEYLVPVNDKEIYDELIEEFRDLVADKIISGEYEEEEIED